MEHSQIINKFLAIEINIAILTANVVVGAYLFWQFHRDITHLSARIDQLESDEDE